MGITSINHGFTMSGLGCGHDDKILPFSPPSVRLIKCLERRSFSPRSDDFQIGLRGRFVDCYRDLILPPIGDPGP